MHATGFLADCPTQYTVTCSEHVIHWSQADPSIFNTEKMMALLTEEWGWQLARSRAPNKILWFINSTVL